MMFTRPGKQHNGRSVDTRPRPSRFVWICRLRYRSLLMRMKQQSRHWRWSRNGMPAVANQRGHLSYQATTGSPGCAGCGWRCYYGRPLGGLGTRHRCYLLGGLSIILAMASTTAGSSASEGFGSFHLFHQTSILIPWVPGCLFCCLFVLVVLCLFCVCFLFCLFLVVAFTSFTWIPRVPRGFNLIQSHLIEMLLDDRQGFTARSARRKKKEAGFDAFEKSLGCPLCCGKPSRGRKGL